MTEVLDVIARLLAPENRADPFPFFAWLRANDPIHRTPTGTYVLSRYADVERVFRDSGTVFRSPDADTMEKRFPGALAHRSIAVFATSIAVSNPPVHTRLRKVISREFTARRVTDLQPRITRICDDLLTDITPPLLDGETVDLHHHFAEPLSVGTMGELLGIPTGDRRWLAGLVEGILSAFPGAPDHVLERADGLTEDMIGYFTSLIDDRRTNPRDDLITALSRTDGHLALDEIVPMLWGLWCAGFKTSAAGITSGILATLANPGQHHWLTTDPTAFANEVLRHRPPTILTPFVRIATRTVEFDGGTIPEGADVRLLIGSANRDPSMFPNPDTFDPARDTKPSLTFAGGIHFCAGAGLARAEMVTALPALHTALPHLTPAEDPTWSPAIFHHMVRALPVQATR